MKRRRRLSREPALRIRIRPTTGRRYVEVLIWATHTEMVAHKKREGQYPLDGVASCTETLRWRVDTTGRMRRSEKVAEVNMRADRLDVLILAHELLHAALAWCRRVRGFDFTRLGAEDSVTGEEEGVAHLQSVLLAEAIRVLEPRGLLSMTPTITHYSEPIVVRRR